MEYDIKLIDHWDAPEEDGAPLLTMPNVALPLHQLCPRTIDPKRWTIMRKRCYMDANYTCQASKLELGHGGGHAHELYSTDWANQTATFKRVVCLAPSLHTTFIHSGRALTLFERGEATMPKRAMLSTLEQGFSLIRDWNEAHPDEEPLRVSSTFLDWAKNPSLKDDVETLIKQYDMKFYDFDKACFNAKNWGKWKLVWNGREYPTKFATQEDWREAMTPEDKKLNGVWKDLDDMLKEAE